MDRVKLILGTMTFGPQVNAEESHAMVQRFVDSGYSELDTAYVYNEGKTEGILGSLLEHIPDESVIIGTKVNPRITGKLDANAVTMQFNESLNRLGRDAVDILYFHFPDYNTPIEEALAACTDLHGQGKFRELGLSNFPAWMVVDIWHICKKRGWLKPSVYQGMYNGISRNVESELFPALRKLGIRFYAFNPLAGGMLTGKHSHFDDNPSPGRFSRLQSYRDRYWKKAIMEAVNGLTIKCREVGIEPTEAAFRWLTYHSFLNPHKGDGIIIGASSMKQLKQNLTAAVKGALPKSLVSAFDDAWEDTKPDSPAYFRYFLE